MHRWLLALTLAVSAGVLQAQKSPAADATTHDFGRLRQGQPVTHEFKVLNPREAGAARILRVDLNGPGMTARFKPDVGPGDFASVRITWNTSKIDGAVQAEAVVRWADPKRPPVTLTIRGYVEAPIELLPMGAVFFSAFADERPEQVLQIVNHQDQPLVVSRIEVFGSHFAAKLQEVQRGRRYEVRVTIPHGLAPGRFQERMTIHTDSPARPIISVPVNVFLKADIYANPEVIDFGDVEVAQLRRNPALLRLLTQTFLLKRRQGPFEVRGTSTEVPGLVIRVSSGNEPAHQIDVSLAPDKLAPRSLAGTLRIKTSDARFPEVVVPIRGRLR